MSSTEAGKPLPEPTPASRPYWEAAREHRLAIPRCESCGAAFFYPRSTCPRCLSDEIVWEDTNGRGEVHSFTVIRQATTPGFEVDVPYVYAIVELEAGVRLPSNVVGVDIEEVTIGMPVQASFDDVTPQISLPKFRPLGAAE